jgi:hypothetical protein
LIQRKYLNLIGIWLCLLLAIAASFVYHLDKKATAFFVIVFGFVTQAFTGLISIIGLMPVVGPVIAKVLAWPLFLTLNGLAYLITFFALGRGKKKRVLESRVLVTTFLFGILIGFLLGKIF